MNPVIIMCIVVCIISIICSLIYIACYATSNESTQSYQYNSSLTDEENLNNISKITTALQFKGAIKEYTNQARNLYESLIEVNLIPNTPMDEETLLIIIEGEGGIERIKVYYEEVVSTMLSIKKLMNKCIAWASFLKQAYKRFSARLNYLNDNRVDPPSITAFNNFVKMLNSAFEELTIFRNSVNSLEAEAIRIETLLNNRAN